VSFDQIPAALRHRRAWVVWKSVQRRGDEKATKIPYVATAPTRKASVDDPTSWSSFDDAVAAAKRDDIAGIGFVITAGDPYCGIDLDACVENGVIDPPAAAIVETLDSYTELSPSGKGLHVIIEAELNGRRNRTGATPWGGGAFECYDRGRFLTVTGETRTASLAIERRQAELDTVHAELFPPESKPPPADEGATPDMPDEEILARAFDAKNGPKFKRVWSGWTEGYGDDESAADFALCSMLAYWTGANGHAQIDRLFRRSKRMREKWDERRGESTYGAQTIARAIAGCHKFYEPPRGGAPPEEQASSVQAPETADLLQAVGVLIRRFVVLPSTSAYLAVSLFVLHTWAFDAAHATPYLVVESPEKRAGKTRLLDVLKLICRYSIKASSVTAAAIFQSVTHGNPTLLIDEADAIFASSSERCEDLRGVMNAGNVPGSPVMRGGKDGKPVSYDVFCPKVIAGIATGKLPDTIRDRAILIAMHRKLRQERVERLRHRRLRQEVDLLRAQAQAWAAANADALERFELDLDGLDDRLEEAWEPLIAIAELAGGEYPEKARKAAVALATGREEEDSSVGHRLLANIRDVFGFSEKMRSAELLHELNGNEDWGYSSWSDGKGITSRSLSNRLRPYGISPRDVKVDGKAYSGYQREQFTDVWRRYLPPTSPTSPVDTGDTPDSYPRPEGAGRGYENAENADEHWGVGEVGGKSAPTEPESKYQPSCSCETPALTDELGRCTRCWGTVEDDAE
jgi:hypothetical protein